MTSKPARSWLGRLKEGLARSSSRMSQGIAGIFTGRKLDQATLQALEELLIAGDLGPETAAKITADLRRSRFDTEITEREAREALAGLIAQILGPVAVPLAIDASRKPHVVLVVGVNGTGKTTTIGKLARQLRDEGRTVMLCAGDTFRAAAIDQLKIWGERAGAEVVAREPGANSAGLVYDALAAAQAKAIDVLLIDTAGRLHNKAHLMDELDKIIRVIRKLDAGAPHSTLLVLDATTGQNAHAQVEMFRATAPVTGLIVTKLDGTARGGVLVALAARFGIPVNAIGIGEGIEDLRPFTANDFARGLLDLEA
jgi:fused signal recognition particle receptor